MYRVCLNILIVYSRYTEFRHTLYKVRDSPSGKVKYTSMWEI
jgi:hypothetical protein